MRNGDEASPSIILAGLALLVKMVITLEPCGSFGSNFLYLCILTLSSHYFLIECKTVSRLHLASFGRSSSFNENAHNA